MEIYKKVQIKRYEKIKQFLRFELILL